MKKSLRILVTALIVLAGTGITVYPLISNYLYEKSQRETVLAYDRETEGMSNEDAGREWEQAREYNRVLLDSKVILSDPFDPEAFAGEESGSYAALLDSGVNGLMGYLEIPVLDLELGMYHGTGARSLELGVGHLENSSLPVGGEGSHAVLSAHTGLPDKKLFTDLELMEKGDIFFIHVLDEILAYKVNQIKVVEPDNVADLMIQKGEDYVTLVTCTPYGVNSHRLLVRGTRIPYEEAEEASRGVEQRSGSQWMRQYFLGIAGGISLLLFFLLVYRLLRGRRSER